ncbi:MAG: amino acid ABC transporter permease [Actinomycetota bacterium]|nr:amino acid ABC transporter permease [Actinomycetota bacterium]
MIPEGPGDAGQEAGGERSAPDTRGGTSRFAVTILAIGALSLALVLVGTVAIQVAYSQRAADPAACLKLGIIPYTPATANGPAHGTEGWQGVCHIVEGLVSTTQKITLEVAFALAIVAMSLGWGKYRSMNSRRKRDHAVTGAVFGLQAVTFGAALWVFANGQPEKFALNFLNFYKLRGHDGVALLWAIKYTLILAFGGEIVGIVIGLILAMLVISTRRSVRAPARGYINLFRGTPLLVQLSIGYFGINLGLGLHLSSFTVATAVLGLNMGAYSAEVFRAGIQSIERGQMEAARSVGMTYLQAMRHAVVPQAVRRVIPPLMNEFVILIKDTSLIVFIGIAIKQYELFAAAQQGYSDTYNATFFLAASAGYLIVTLPMIAAVNAVERRLRSGLLGIAGVGM